jgi:hypothetical protein
MVADDLPTTARLAALQRALDQAAEPEHARDVAAAAHGFEQAMRDAGLGKQIEELRPYRELWIMARWKLGKMLAKMVRGKPGPQKKDTSSGLTYLKDELDRLGLTKQTANETQRLAAFPEPELLGALKRAEDLPELGEMIRLAKPYWSKEQRKRKHKNIRAKAAEIEEELGPFPLIYADPPWKWGHFGERDKR